MKKIFTLTIISLLVFTNFQAAHSCIYEPSFSAHIKLSFENSSPLIKCAAITGATVAGIWLAKKAYDYLFETSDAQEIERALNIIEQHAVFNKNVAYAYHHEQQIIYPILYLDAPKNYDNITIISYLKNEICAKFAYRPFYSYVIQLEHNIYNTKESFQTLAQEKLRIFERKLRLMKDDSANINDEHKALLMYEYNAVINKITHVHDALQELHYMLQEIRAYIINMLEYQLECKQVHIEALQRENARLHNQALAGSAALNYAYLNKSKTHVTHVNVYHDRPNYNSCVCDYATSPEHTVVINNTINYPPCSISAENENAYAPEGFQPVSQSITYNDPQAAAYDQFRDDVYFTP